MTKRQKRQKRQSDTLNKAVELIAKWSAKGHTDKRIIGGLWDWKSVSAEKKGNTWTVSQGMRVHGNYMSVSVELS